MAHRKSVARRAFWAIAFLGVILPLGTALAVRVWLDFQGKPVWTWLEIWELRWFFGPRLIPLALPHVLLAFWARRVLLLHLSVAERVDVASVGGLIGALVALSAATILVHWGLWQPPLEGMADVLALASFYFPIVFAFFLAVTSAGLVLGHLIGFIVAAVKHYPHRAAA